MSETEGEDVLSALNLSPAWLETELRAGGCVASEARLLSCSSSIIGQDRGWCSDVVLCRLTWSAQGSPEEVVLKVTKLSTITSAIDDMLQKGGVEKEDVRAKADDRLQSVLRVHETESAVYDVFRGKDVLPMAKSFFSQPADPGTATPGVIALESFVGRGKTANLSDGLRLGQLKPIVEALAALHAFSWRNPQAGQHFPKPNKETAYAGWDSMVAASLNSLAGMEGRFTPLRDTFAKSFLTQRDFYVDLLFGEGLHSLPFPTVIVHGDFQANNFLFAPDASSPTGLGDRLVAVLDWQGALWKGSPAMDLARVLVTAAAPGVREEHEEELLRHYYAALTKETGSDCPMGWEQLREAYSSFFAFAAGAAAVGASFFIQSAPQLLALDDGDAGERRQGLLDRAFSALSHISKHHK